MNIEDKETERIRTSFKSYFSKHSLNQFLNNLYVLTPKIAVLAEQIAIKSAKASSRLVKGLLLNRERNHKKITQIRLDESLKMDLKKMQKGFPKLSKQNKFKYEAMDLEPILNKQNSVLREMFEEQKRALKKETLKIIEEEQERIRKKYESKSKKKRRR